MLGSLIRVLDRQGLLKGDLNIVQRAGLQWLMNEEIDEQISLEKLRTQHLALASNPATSPEFLKILFEDEKRTQEEEWIEINSVDQMEDFLSQYG